MQLKGQRKRWKKARGERMRIQSECKEGNEPQRKLASTLPVLYDLISEADYCRTNSMTGETRGQ